MGKTQESSKICIGNRLQQCVVEGEISAFQKIKRGVRQGCVLSPDLFSLYSEIIMRNIEGQPGIRVGGHKINNLRYADDTVLISENEKRPTTTPEHH